MRAPRCDRAQSVFKLNWLGIIPFSHFVLGEKSIKLYFFGKHGETIAEIFSDHDKRFVCVWSVFWRKCSPQENPHSDGAIIFYCLRLKKKIKNECILAPFPDSSFLTPVPFPEPLSAKLLTGSFSLSLPVDLNALGTNSLEFMLGCVARVPAQWRLLYLCVSFHRDPDSLVDIALVNSFNRLTKQDDRFMPCVCVCYQQRV